MKIKTSELSGAALDYVAAKLEGDLVPTGGAFAVHNWAEYSTQWAYGGPIIERERLQISYQSNGKFAGQWGCNNWHTNRRGELVPGTQYGPTPLIAAMRCFVASKLGDKVAVPEELL